MKITAINNFAVQEHNVYVGEFPRDLLPVVLSVEGGRLKLPDRPGLGVDLNEEAAADYPFECWEAPHWRRRDSSYTNW